MRKFENLMSPFQPVELQGSWWIVKHLTIGLMYKYALKFTISTISYQLKSVSYVENYFVLKVQ